MCGIAGYIDFRSQSSVDDLRIMVNTLDHRGPDDNGIELFQSDEYQVGLGQSRLSIIDLSHGGHQPMRYKHLSIVFNGEIYNYREIKKDLLILGHSFVSDSDTEVILHAVEEWGLDAVHRFIGMFAFVIYDRKNKTVSLTRDRPGVKPLYYYNKDGLLLFGSELKALMAHPKFEKEIADDTLIDFLHYGYIPSPKSIFKNTYKLKPGHHLTICLDSGEIKLEQYWNTLTFYNQPKLSLSYNEAKDELHKLLKSACAYRMVADVPVGVFLSGGYDSTAVTAILQAQSQEQIKTFTIGFEEGNNEAPFAKETANYLGTDHEEYYCSTLEAQSIIEDLPYYFDEPFGDSSAIPTILVSKLARKKVTVALSADAGDELFFGYNSYFEQASNLKKLAKIPGKLKPVLSNLGWLANAVLLNHTMAHKAQSFLSSLNRNSTLEAYNMYASSRAKSARYIEKFFKNDLRRNRQEGEEVKQLAFSDPLEAFVYLDYTDYLPNDILTKVDRATMSVSLEGREPLLDHRLLELAAHLPLEFKYQNEARIGKDILRDIVHEYVPKEMMDRPKTGFSIPVLEWLRTDLYHLQTEYFSKEALKWSGLFNVTFVLKEIELFNQRKLYYSSTVWYLLMFQMWYKKWILDK